MRRTISVTNTKVDEIFDKSQNISRLIEDSVLFYEEHKNGILLTESQVRELFCELIKQWMEFVK